jgi:CheY-like chemotaxis protein/HPt (histidine-containing phosphotransfer) domain-containing protein
MSETEKSISLRFQVEDTGIGIAEGNSERLFQPFTQADSSTTRKYGGTGLGLSICRRLVELMGGTIGFQSMFGKGTTFWFEVALQKSSERIDPRRIEAAPALTEFHWPKTRILVAEDIPTNQRVITLLLERLGITPTLAENGIQAIEAMRNESFDLIFMDCYMPELDGYSTTERLRQSENAQWRQVPIIAMTANTMPSNRQRCLDLGMSDYIAKPIRFSQLVTILHKWLPTAKKTPAEQGTEEVLDSDYVEKIERMDPGCSDEIRAELAALISRSLPQRVIALGEALRSAEFHAITREAHALKSSVCYLSAKKLETLCDQLELLGEKGELSGSQKLYQEIKDESSNVLRSLDQLHPEQNLND